MKKIVLILLVQILVGSTIIFAQDQFSKIESIDNVTFYYNWKHSKFFKKHSPLVLVIKATNDNDYKVNATFTVDFYWDAVHHSTSDKQTFKLKSHKSVIGTMRRMGFESNEFTNEQLLSDRFTIELNGIKVIKVD